MSRRIGRILAFQALYSWDVGGVDIEDLLTFSWLEKDDEDSSKEPKDDEIINCLLDKQMELFEKLSEEKKQEVFIFSRLLVRGTVENIEEIDNLIKSHLSTKWTLERINKVALAVIRMSIYQLLYQKDVSSTIVIDEAVAIVKEYGVDDSHKFTNAILDSISKELSKTQSNTQES